MPKKSSDFREVFSKGSQSYDTWLGNWWWQQSMNAAHKRAYKNIAEHIHSALRKAGRPEPRFIVDYACGSGGALRALVRRFPRTKLVGLDGAQKLLWKAKEDLDRIGCEAGFVRPEKCFRENGPTVRLVKTPLPNYSLPQGKADVVLFLFPNMNPDKAEMAYIKKHFRVDRTMQDIAWHLSQLPEDESNEKVPPQDAADIYETLLYERAVSDHIHQLLKRKGLWLKGDYANTPREGIIKLVHWKLLLSESALDIETGKKKKLDKLQYLGNKFFRSSIILDLYYQLRDPAFRKGGFFISTFQPR